MLYNKQQVLSFLPHRPPFLFIDSVKKIILSSEELEKKEVVTPQELIGGKVIAQFYTDPQMSIFKGHFPDNPILPGVIQIEIMAQASAFISTKLMKAPISKSPEMALLSVEKARFRKPILPDMHLEIHMTCLKIRGKIMSYEGNIFNEGQLMSEARILASLNIDF